MPPPRQRVALGCDSRFGALVLVSVLLSACAVKLNSMVMYPNLKPALRFETNGVTINYTQDILRDDTRPVLVLIHGFGASLQSWNDIYPALVRDHSVVRIDLKGSGFSSKPEDGKYAPEDQAAIVMNVLVGLRLRRVVLIGHSLGGGIALLTALSASHSSSGPQIEGLILIDSAGFPQRLPFFVDGFSNPMLRQLNRLFTARFKTRFTLRRLFVMKDRVTDERVWRYAYFLTLNGTESALEATAKALKHLSSEGLATKIAEISVPTLIIWGQEDPAISVTHAAMFRKAIPGSQVLILPKTGHVPHEERPEETFKAIRGFLETLK
jgi:pimeloyl-ACP methyl ester carboxylesterase